MYTNSDLQRVLAPTWHRTRCTWVVSNVAGISYKSDGVLNPAEANSLLHSPHPGLGFRELRKRSGEFVLTYFLELGLALASEP